MASATTVIRRAATNALNPPREYSYAKKEKRIMG
jgi:hypothetical protein